MSVNNVTVRSLQTFLERSLALAVVTASCLATTTIHSAGQETSPASPQAVTFCNTATITIPAAGTGTGSGAPATPYPSSILISGVATTTVSVTIDIKGIQHAFGQDIDVLLVGPGGQQALIMSDVGGTAPFTGVNVTLDDAAASPISTSATLVSGTFRPTNTGAGDQFPAPAPAPGTSAVLSIFSGQNSNGLWKLYVVDDASGDTGAIATGWCINLTACTADVQCDDGSACTDDTCTAGTCVHDPVLCDDGNACTNDSCNSTNGLCVHNSIDCNDNDPCTDDSCDLITGCIHTPNGCGATSCGGGSVNACASPSFAAAQNYPSGGSIPAFVVTGDFDGNGYLDLAVTNNSGIVTLLRGIGDGTFQSATTAATGSFGRMAAADLDGDQDLDLAAPSGGNVAVLLNDGTGAFTLVGPFPAGPSAAVYTVAVGDVNGDGDPDVVTANGNTPGTVSVILGNGTGTAFAPPVNFAVGAAPIHVTVADLNGDQRADLAVANADSSNISILLGNGTPSLFGLTVNYGVGTDPRATAVGDFDCDGDLDLAVANGRANSARVLLGNGNGTFLPAVAYPVGASPVAVVVDDFNGDGMLDVVTADADSNRASVLLGAGNGTFQPAVALSTGTVPFDVAVGDFNGCGPDLVTANRGTNNLSVLINNCQNASACDDGNACTIDSCAGWACVHTPVSCDDGNGCTNDSCDPITGCGHTNDDSNLCTDGNACTNDYCSGGVCVGTAIDCDDHDPCTDDECSVQGLCVHTSNGCGATGACCTLPGCQVTTEGMCVALGGDYAGEGITCVAASCPTESTLQEPGCRDSKNPLLTAPSSGVCAGCGAGCGGPVDSEDPVYLFSGEFYQSEVDLRIPGRGLDFVWARKYRSRVGPVTYLGNGWDFSYNIAIAAPSGSRPSEVLNVRFPNKQTVSWDQPTNPGGPVGDLRYCTLRSTDRSNFGSAGTTSFVEADSVDQFSSDVAIPATGGVFYYLISAKNEGGEGTLGTDSHLNPRGGIPCGSPQGDFILMDGDTRRDVYKLQPDGSRTAAQLFQVLTQNPDGSFTLTFPDRGTWNFRGFDHSLRQGKIASIADRNGNTLTFTHDAQGRLVTVTDTLARNIQVAYGANGLISTVTDFAGRQVKYAYYNDGDAGGAYRDLKSVTTPAVTGTPTANDFPTGKTTSYTYSTGFALYELNHNLLTITDPKGQTRLTNVYASDLGLAQLNFDRVIRQVWGNPGDIIDYVYVAQAPSAANNFASLKTIVNDRVGNVKEYFFNAANRDVMMREFSGRADPDQSTTDSLNRPTGQLRLDDPPYFETRWGYNKDAQPTTVMNPNSSQESMTYDPANASRRAQQNLLERCRLAGPLGGAQGQVCETFEYSAGFGGCCGGNFVTRHVDGRGNETLHVYDANGNRIHTQYPIPSVVEDYEYNASGQVTADVLPDNGSGDRQLDQYTYYASGPQRGYLHQKIVDATGFALTTAQEYDAAGNVVRTIDPRGHDTLYVVNQRNQTVRETSREVEPGSGIRYRKDTFYDANDNVVRVDVQNVDADGVVQANATFTTVSEYEILNRPVKTCREVGLYTGSIPGTVGQPTCTGLPAAEFITEEFQYDANRNVVLARRGEATEGRQPANVTATLWDERELVFRVIRSPGDAGQSSTQYDYDASRNLKKVSEGLENNPRISLNSYDGYGRPVGSIDPMGNTASTSYDAAGNMVSWFTEGQLTDLSGASGNVRLAETEFVYDAMNRRIREEKEFFDPATQAPIGDGRSIIETFYTPSSEIARVVDDNGHETFYAYDTSNRVSTIEDAKGNTTTFNYDTNSNPLTVTELELSDLGSPPETFVTTNTYDNLDRLTSTTDSLGNEQHALYDSRNNETRLTDAKGNVTRYVYDGVNRLVRTERDLTTTGDGTGVVTITIATNQAWDDSSRLIGQTDDNANTTAYAYDALNRQVSTTYADATVQLQTYDVHDNVVSATDANGTVTVSTYDSLDRVSTLTITRGADVLGTTSELWKYDGLSRVVYAQDDDTLVTQKYDSLGDVIQAAQKIGSGPTRALTGVFDGDGNRTSVTYPSGRTYTTTFDTLDRMKTISDPASVATFSYLGPARVERRDNGNGTSSSLTYDGVGRITGTHHEKLAPLTVLDERSYVWDPMDNKISRTDLRPGGITSTYGYDSAYRLTVSSDSDGTTNYALDGVGNRTSVTGGLTPGSYTMSPALPVPADFQTNQYTTMPREPGRLYDENGDVTELGDRVGYSLGPNGCPGVCGVDDDGNGATDDDCEVCPRSPIGQDVPFGDDVCSGGHPLASTIEYDYRNQMVQFRLQTGCGAPEAYIYDAFGRRLKAGSVEYFLDDAREIEERNAGGNVIAAYVYGNYVDDVIRQERNGVAYFHHTDDLANVMALTDSAGNVVERYDYDEFGKPKFYGAAGVSIPGSGLGNAVLFNGRRYDPSTGFYFYRTRYLDPAAGRFTSRDSIGVWGDEENLGGGNAYAGSNPWSNTDPMGEGAGSPVKGVKHTDRPKKTSDVAGPSDPVKGIKVSGSGGAMTVSVGNPPDPIPAGGPDAPGCPGLTAPGDSHPGSSSAALREKGIQVAIAGDPDCLSHPLDPRCIPPPPVTGPGSASVAIREKGVLVAGSEKTPTGISPKLAAPGPSGKTPTGISPKRGGNAMALSEQGIPSEKPTKPTGKIAAPGIGNPCHWVPPRGDCGSAANATSGGSSKLSGPPPVSSAALKEKGIQ